jgi:hypothetical protein
VQYAADRAGAHRSFEGNARRGAARFTVDSHFPAGTSINEPFDGSTGIR